MRQTLTNLTLALALLLPLNADVVLIVQPPAAGGVALIIDEQFEGTGYEESWTEGGTVTPDEDYTATALEGSQSLQYTIVAQTGSTYHAFTPDDEVFVRFRIQWVSNASTESIVSFRDDSSQRGAMQLAAAGTLRAHSGSAGGSTVGALTVATTYYVWMRYKQGSGANSECEIAFSLDTTRPTSGDNYVIHNSGTSTSTVNRIYLGATTGQTESVIIDDVKVSVVGYP